MIGSRLSPNFAPQLDIDTVTKLVAASTVSELPAPGFNWSATSQDELDKLGFPKRPDPSLQPAAHAFWQKMFAPPLIFEPYDFKVLPFLTRPRSAFFAQFSPQESSQNWSGAYIAPRDGTVMYSIWGAYQVPTPKPPPGGKAQKYRSSTWIGFDGQRRYYMSTLPQFGTAQNLDMINGVLTPSYFAWWQWWARDVSGAAYPITLAAPQIHPGDLIMVFMQVAGDRGGVSFVMKNATTGSIVHFFQGPPDPGVGLPFKVSGATAEWVMERSADAGSPKPLELPAYDTVDFHDCGATAINPRTGAIVERSLSAAKLIDMFAGREGPQRIVKNSVTRRVNTSEFLTKYQQ